MIANAASQSESAASSFPTTRSSCEHGGQQQALERPALALAADGVCRVTSVSSAPTATATWSVRFTASRCSRKLSAWFVAVR